VSANLSFGLRCCTPAAFVYSVGMLVIRPSASERQGVGSDSAKATNASLSRSGGP
jgi:hypothetical protein